MLFRALTHAFLGKGWHVTFIEEFHSWADSYTDYSSSIDGLRILSYKDRASLEKLLSSEGLLIGVKLILKFSGSSIFHDRFVDEWCARQRTARVNPFVLLYVDADAPVRLPYIVSHKRFYLHNIARHFDGVWVMLGGKRAVDEYLTVGAPHVWYLPAAIDATFFQPAEGVTDYRSDLLFVGNPTRSRDQAVGELFFRMAEAHPDMVFVLAGAEWGNITFPRNVEYLGYVKSEQLPELYRSSRLVLNVTRDEMTAYGDAASLRLFEAAACGACIVSDCWKGIDKLFVIKSEILIATEAGDVERCLTHVDAESARSIGRRARARVLSEHTADVRIEQVLSLLKGCLTHCS